MIRVETIQASTGRRKIPYFPIIYQDLISRNRFALGVWAANSENYDEILARGPYIITRRRSDRHDFRADFAVRDRAGDGKQDR
jgi:hypothetical protein